MSPTNRTSLLAWLGLVLLLSSAACGPEAGSAQAADTQQTEAPPKVEPARFGDPFPAGTFRNLNAAAGRPAAVDLGREIGSKPLVLYYWIAGNPRADQVFQELTKLVERLGGESVALYGVAYPRTQRDNAAIAARIRELGISVPVLDDEGFELGQRLRVQSVPNVTIIDGAGRLRLTNGASLVQDLEYKMTLATAIERVADKGSLGTYGYLQRYYPVRELVGQKCPDFKAPLLSTSVEQRWSSMIRGDQLNVLIFWSVDCPHCRTSLPEINDWLKQNGDRVNVITAAKVTDETTRIKTREFCQLNGFAFPTLVDQDLRIGTLYNITSTPTILIIGPDGVVDSVLLDVQGSFGETILERRQALLGPAT